MISRRSPRRRLSGSSCSRAERGFAATFLLICSRTPRLRRGATSAALALFAAFALQAGAARADRAGAALKETRAGAEIDWEAGTIAASAGAAADLRMPSVDLSRPGAERRAKAGAVAKLRSALAALPLGAGSKLTAPEIERAVGRARAVDTQYQSNGGAVVRVEIRFGDWLEAPNPAVALSVAVPSSHLGAAPTARIGKRDVRVGAAVYRTGDGKADKNVADARVDKDGRLVLAGTAQLADGAQLADKLARGLVMIYVGKLQR